MRFWTVLPVVVSMCCGGALAVAPETWEQSSEADFAKGKFDSTAVSSLGEVRLSREIKVLAPCQAAPEVVSAVVAAGGKVYAASGTEPIVYTVAEGKTEKFAELPGTMVACLIWTGRELLAGTGGDACGIYRIDSAGKVQKLWADPETKYVWAILPVRPGLVYAATGPGGKVFAVDSDGKATIVYEAGKLARNILCLAHSKSGLLYAGTDEKGLVVEIDPGRKDSSRVILDADEKEIAALIPDDSGGLYAATSDSARARADGKARPNEVKAGKPTSAPETRPAPEPLEERKAQEGPETAPASRPTVERAEVAGKRASQVSVDIQLAGDSPGPDAVEQSSAVEAMDDEADEAMEPAASPLAGKPSAEVPDREAAEVAKPAVEAAMREVRPPAAAAAPGGGNAVYYIRRDGLVETRFRRPVTILAMLLDKSRLYLGTGNGGAIYSLSIDGQEIVRLTDVDAKQVTALDLGGDGAIFFATANKGSVGLLASGLANTGTFRSDALDAKQIAQWGTVQVRVRATGGAKVTLATRSGNLAEPQDATWSAWSNEHPAGNGFLSIDSPPARFLQYRLTLARDEGACPVVDHVRIVYQVGNLAPTISAVTVKAGGDKPAGSGSPAAGSSSKAFRHVRITATDPNNDELVYNIAFRELGTEGWIEIAKDLKAPTYVWDTHTVGDGTYEVRAAVSDSPSNPPSGALKAERISDLVVVDNTPPVIESLGAKPVEGKIVVSASAADASSRIVSAHYSVDSQEDWVVLAPKDGMCDSNAEMFGFELADLKPGAHRIAVKVADLYDNVSYAAITITAGARQ